MIREKRLLQYIIRKFRPHIYASEWVAGRFDFGCTYKLVLRGYIEIDDEPYPIFAAENTFSVEQWLGKKWEKVRLLLTLSSYMYFDIVKLDIIYHLDFQTGLHKQSSFLYSDELRTIYSIA